MTTSTSVRRTLAIVAIVAGDLLGSAPASWSQEPAPPPAEGEVVNSWALAPGDGTLEAGERPNLAYQLPPGGTADDVVTLFNYSNVPLTFQLYSTDAFNNDDGGFDVLPGSEAPTDIGSWLTLPTDSLTVPAGTQASFPISLRVPADARPGDHAGALLAASAALTTNEEGDTITLDRRTGTRIYVRVDGPLQPEVAVEGLTTSYTPSLDPLDGTAEVTYSIVNRGNVRLSTSHALSIGGPFGLLGRSLPAEQIDELLPGESVEITRTIEGVSATALQFTEVDLDPEVIGGGEQAVATDDGRSFGLAIPYTVVALLLVALLAWYARRAYQRHRFDPVDQEDDDDDLLDLTDDREPQLT